MIVNNPSKLTKIDIIPKGLRRKERKCPRQSDLDLGLISHTKSMRYRNHKGLADLIISFIHLQYSGFVDAFYLRRSSERLIRRRGIFRLKSSRARPMMMMLFSASYNFVVCVVGLQVLFLFLEFSIPFWPVLSALALPRLLLALCNYNQSQNKVTRQFAGLQKYQRYVCSSLTLPHLTTSHQTRLLSCPVVSSGESFLQQPAGRQAGR